MKPCVFPCKVAAAGGEGQLVCAAGAATLVFFAALKLASSCRSHWNAFMIGVMFFAMCIDTSGFAT